MKCSCITTLLTQPEHHIMRFTPDIPTFFEWLARIQADAAEAKQLMIAIKARDRIQGLMADPSLTISLNEYDQAQTLVAKAAFDLTEEKRLIYFDRLGQALLGPYPEREDWAALIDGDPVFARDVCVAWKTRQAMLGVAAPKALVRSVELYYEVSKQRP
jgi:hypothetical protein